MKFWHNLLYTGLLATAVVGNEELTPDKVEADVNEENLRSVLWNLTKIAQDHGGNRAFGLPGYTASANFVLEQLHSRPGKHLDTYFQPFTHLFETTRKISVTGPKGENVDVVTLQYNTATPLPGGITAQLIDTPVDDVRGSACFADQWEKTNATGRIALIKRGVCPIVDKLRLAKTHGALAALLYNQTPGRSIGSATLSASNIGLLIPVGVVTLEDGTNWSKRLAAGETLEVNLLVDSIAEDRESWNIISETKEGDPNNVILLGAHLDSVQMGPGVNDDGSGIAALLELAASFERYQGFPNKVRFAFWGAEESGLIGSLYYGKHLSEQEADRIRFYFNYDMIGSKQPNYTVYADSDAHLTGGSILLNYLEAQGKHAYYSGFGSSSDYLAFLKLGIPSSGLFTGAGSPEDACYHQPCDTIDNINWEAITLNTKAAGRAAAQFALSLDGVPPRTKTSVNPRSKQGIAKSLSKWAGVTSTIEKTPSCGGPGNNLV